MVWSGVSLLGAEAEFFGQRIPAVIATAGVRLQILGRVGFERGRDRRIADTGEVEIQEDWHGGSRRPKK